MIPESEPEPEKEPEKDPEAPRRRKGRSRGSRSRSSPADKAKKKADEGAEDPEDGADAPLDAEDRTRLLLAVGAGLEEVIPGFHIVDRDLELEDGARADLAGADPTGRLVVVLLAPDDPDQAALEVLDTCSWLRRNLATLARHLPPGEIDPELEPRTVVIDARSSDRLLLRLVPLLGTGVELFGLQFVHSAAQDRSYLVPRTPPAPIERGSQVRAEASFLEALPAGVVEFGSLVVDRISRLDPELVAVGGAESLAWRLGAEVVVRLDRSGDRLQASVPPDLEPRVLAEAPDLEPILEEALARIVPTFDLDGEAEPALRENPAITGTNILTDEEIDFLHG